MSDVVRYEYSRVPGALGRPHLALRPFLAGRYSGFSAEQHSGAMLLPATASTRLIVKVVDSAHRPPAFVNGARGSFAVIDGACAPEYLEARLSPLGGYALLGVPMREVSAGIVDLVEVLGPEGRRLQERISEAPSWVRRFEILDDALLRRAGTGPRPAPEVVRVWRRLVAEGGATPVGAMAREVGWSHKHLIDRFKDQVGLTPKTAARLVRFGRATRLATRSPRESWAQIAAETGYADQAHLVREFRSLAGTTPAEFERRASPEPAGAQPRQYQVW